MKHLICILLLSISGCLCTGCRVIWTDDIFAASLFTDIQAENSQLISDPNGLKIQAGSYGSETDDIKIKYNPYTGVELSTD